MTATFPLPTVCTVAQLTAAVDHHLVHGSYATADCYAQELDARCPTVCTCGGTDPECPITDHYPL